MPNRRRSSDPGDTAALALLKRVETTMLGLKTYRAACWTTLTFDTSPEGTAHERATLLAVKPNLMRYDSWQRAESEPDAVEERRRATPDITFVSDGENAWWQFGTTYRTDKRTQPDALHTVLEPWNGFYSADDSPHALVEHYREKGDLVEVRRVGAEPVDGTPCEMVFVHVRTTYNGEALEYRTTWYVGADDLVRRKVEWTQFAEKGGHTRDAILSEIRTDEPAPAVGSGAFTYVPPEGVTREKKERPKSALAAGTTAPDFTATDRDGRPIRLGDLRGSVVVLDFWASWCGPCVSSMPHNQDVSKRLRGEGLPVVLLALDNSEGRDAFLAWVNKHPDLDAVTFAHADRADADIGGKLYHVSGIPTQYVIDPEGRVRDHFVGYSGPTDDLEKAIRAALK